MDAERFDDLARFLSSRRTALGGLLAGVLLPLEAAARDKNKGKGKKDSQKGRSRGKGKGKDNQKGKGQGKDKKRSRTRASAQAEGCWRAGACLPKKGANVSQCDLAGYSAPPNLNCTGGNISRANLRDATFRGANFTKANLSGACLVDADFSGATFTNTTNLANAIFCRTTMPDGTVNDSGCGSATACCPTCILGGGACGATIGGSCCGENCTSGICQSCTPATCQSLGKQCGAWPDGCSGTLQCGTCGAQQTCDAGACVCAPASCEAQGKNCGQLPNGCGGTLSCGACIPPQTCGGGGAANVCGCAATTCESLGKQCGEWPDGCGTTLDCGSCGTGQACNNGQCVCTPATCQSLGKQCGEWSDGCGGNLSCGGCSGATPLCCGGACVTSNTWANQTTFGSQGGGLNQFRIPQGIALSGDTLTMWVADTNSGRVSVWTRPNASSIAWTNQTTFGSNGTGSNQFGSPHGVAVSGDTLTAWVADTSNNRISVWTRPDVNSVTWTNQTTFGSIGGGLGQLRVPINIAVSNDTLTVWVTDSINDRVSVWIRPDASSVTWTNQTTFGSSGGSLGQFRLPYGIAVSSDTLTAWVVEQNNARVSVWTRPTASSTVWTVQTGFGSGPGLLANPSGLAVARDRLTVWVADTGNDRMSIWTRPNASSTAWSNQTTFGSSGSGSSQFGTPIGVVVSSDEQTVWVSDNSNHRIAVWTQVCPA